MTRFSIGTAISDAFALIGRRPVSVLVWGLMLVIPIVGSFGLIIPMMGEMFAAMPVGDVDQAQGQVGAWQDEMMAEMMRFQGLSALMNLVQLAFSLVVYTAVMRAVLRPAEKAFFSLRLGMDELRVFVVGLAIIVGMYVLILVLALLGVAIGFGVWGLGAPANWLIVTGVVLGFLVVLFLGLARVSLIAPASVLYRSFAFTEGWALAKGRAGALLGMSLLIFLLVLVIELVLAVIAMVTMMGTMGAMGSELADMGPATGGNPFAAMAPFIEANWPWVALGCVAAAVFYGVVVTLTIAPYASACRQLAATARPQDEF